MLQEPGDGMLHSEIDLQNTPATTEAPLVSSAESPSITAEDVGVLQEDAQRDDAQALDRLRDRLKELSSIELMSDQVFNAIYQQLARADSASPVEKRGVRFREEVIEGAKRHVKAVESAGATNTDLYSELWGKMAEYSTTGDSVDSSRRLQEATKMFQNLTGHINGLVKRGEVDPLVAKVFLRSLPNFKFIGQTNYNDIVRHQEPATGEVLREKNPAYVQETRALWDSYGDESKEEQSGAVLHFNKNVSGGVRHRIYISAALDKAPDRVVRAWRDSLEATGMRDRIYFKIPEGLSNRSETIIVYPTEGITDEDIGKLMTDFTGRCDPNLLATAGIPTAIPVERGFGIAPEPGNVNRLIRYMGLSDRNVSYNQLVTAMTQLSFELAYEEQRKVDPTLPVTPKSLQPQARGYFTQMIKLCGLNPATMMPNAQGGELPAWVGGRKIA